MTEAFSHLFKSKVFCITKRIYLKANFYDMSKLPMLIMNLYYIKFTKLKTVPRYPFLSRIPNFEGKK